MSESVFKACTRPPLLFSVPMAPLMVVGSIILFVSVWTMLLGGGMWTFGLLLPAYITMRTLTRVDDNMFNQLWLKFKCRARNANQKFYRVAVYSPLAYKKRGS